MSNEFILYILFIITPLFFYVFTKLLLQKSILYNKRYSLPSRFSFYKYLKKNNIRLAVYLEINNLSQDLKNYTEKEKRLLLKKLIYILKEFSEDFNFNIFYFSDEKYVLVHKNTKIYYNKIFDLLINNLKIIKFDNIEVKPYIGAATSKSLPKDSEELLDIIISSCHIAKNRNTNYYLINLDNPNNVEKSYGIDDYSTIISHYMCIYDTKKVKIVGCETLVRWKNKEKVLSPNIFIPLAIKRNLISNIDFGIAEDAFKNYQVLLKKNLIDENFIIGINIAKESLSSSFVNRLNSLIGLYKEVSVSNVLIDIDMDTFKNTENILYLRNLKDIGFKICLDSITFNFDELLEIYKKLPYDMIKITTSHYRKPEFLKFKEFLVSNGVQAIATKIEKIDEVHALNNNNLNLVQGFLYGTPTNFDRFEEQIWSNNVFRV